MKSVITILILSLIIVVMLYFWLDKKGGTSYESAELVEVKQVDKLFTTFAYVPLLDYEWGNLKRNFWMGDSVIVGYCWRQYEVGIGYNNASDYFNEYLKFACADSFDVLPEPEILAVNPVSSESFGEYTRMECDRFDFEADSTRISKGLILKQLKDDKQWDLIVDKSRKTLGGFIKIYCGVNE